MKINIFRTDTSKVSKSETSKVFKLLSVVSLFPALLLSGACGDSSFQLKKRLSASPATSIMYAGKATDQSGSSNKLIDQFAIDNFTKIIHAHFQKEFPNVKFVYYKPTKKAETSKLVSGLTAMNSLSVGGMAMQAASGSKPKEPTVERSESPGSFDQSDRPGELRMNFKIHYNTEGYMVNNKRNDNGETLKCTRFSLDSYINFYDAKEKKDIGNNFYSIKPEGSDVHGLSHSYCEGDTYYSKNDKGQYIMDVDGILKDRYEKYEAGLIPALTKITDKIKSAVDKK